jgi:homoserine acetyltransferase
MWQAGDVGAMGGQGDFLKALEGVETRMLIMHSRTDQYFPPEDSETEVKNGLFAPIPTIWGHIAGGGANEVDVKWMDERISEFLK